MAPDYEALGEKNSPKPPFFYFWIIGSGGHVVLHDRRRSGRSASIN
jgi:hypothetical protein